MLVGLSGLLSGYNGGFDFKSGVEYPADVPYTAMRVMLASFGVALVPIAWWTAGEMGWSKYARHWVTICVLCGMSSVQFSGFTTDRQMSDGSVSLDSSFSTLCSSFSHSPRRSDSSNFTISAMTLSETTGGSGSSLLAGLSDVSAVSSGSACLPWPWSVSTPSRISGRSLGISPCLSCVLDLRVGSERETDV